MDYEQHIRALANELGATIDRTTGDSPMADPSRRTLYLSQYDGTVQWYLSSLHELGHIADNPAPKDLIEQMLGTTPRVIDAEARAWEWALDQSMLPFDRARGDIAFTLGTYINDMLGTFGPDAVHELEGGPAARLIARVGADVDTSEAYNWARRLGYAAGTDVADRAWSYSVRELGGAV